MIARFVSAVVLLPALFLGWTDSCRGQDDNKRALKVTSGPDDSAGRARYRKQWAIIIGIDYKKEDRDSLHKQSAADPGVVRSLNNAQNDAQALRDVLISHYGYQESEIKFLCGPAATADAIRRSLTEDFLGNKSEVKENDSVLIFFAGHGHRLSIADKKVGAIAPFDVRIKDQSPVSNSTLRYHEDIIQWLSLCPARHKLLILNCCHSGEVFGREFPRSRSDDRRADSLFPMRALQALASCRANELDDDGKGPNSPFAATLVDALKRLPLRKERHDYFTATELFSFMRDELALWKEQSPDLRSLIKDDGEFRFFPDRNTDFGKYRRTDINVHLLHAMVPGEYGNWWFDETPWFIPSLRMEILVNTDVKRSVAAAIRQHELRKAAEKVRNLLRAHTPSETAEPSLSQLRLKHLETLLNADKSSDSRKSREGLVVELSAREDLKATDLHFLAILQHSLGQEKVASAYERALTQYEAERKGVKQALSEQEREANKALQALCYADYGFYRFSQLNDSERAAELFRNAIGLCGLSDETYPFLVFVLCREADAWQRLGRWGLSVDRLNHAFHLVEKMDPELKTSLGAHALSRRGWAFMEQWRFSEAERQFEMSNNILKGLLDAPDARQKVDLNALVLRFHNLHGLAMANRFKGDSAQAVVKYQHLLKELGKSFQDIRETDKYGQDAPEAKLRLVARWFNSMERLADCNLFADSASRDLREAADDLRSTLRYCYMLPGNQRKVAEAGLMYKQAIVLSLRSPIQDIPLAASYCKRAEALAGALAGNQGDLLDFQRKLTPVIVELFRTCAEKPSCLESKRAALEKLRGAIEGLREKWKDNDHRDYLEFLMFAGKILLDEAVDTDRYETLTDSEMLLGFCRRALRGGAGESLRYLRPYYDAVMETKLRLKPKHAKELLEVHWEATRGKAFSKERRAAAVVALYLLNDKSYLFLDIPGGASTYYCLHDDYSRTEIMSALMEGSEPLDLPREILKELRKIPASTAGERLVECWLDGPNPTVGSGGTAVALRVPFKVPNGFKLLQPGSDSRVAQNK